MLVSAPQQGPCLLHPLQLLTDPCQFQASQDDLFMIAHTSVAMCCICTPCSFSMSPVNPWTNSYSLFPEKPQISLHPQGRLPPMCAHLSCCHRLLHVLQLLPEACQVPVRLLLGLLQAVMHGPQVKQLRLDLCTPLSCGGQVLLLGL